MAKASGGTRQSAPARQQAATEMGFSEQLERNVLERENTIRRDRKESLHAFDTAGNNEWSLQGTAKQVRIPYSMNINSDLIWTHNHPNERNWTGVRSIGVSLSVNDLETAVYYNASEMRAVTPTYTFAMKRPEKGWNASQHEVRREYNKAKKAVLNELRAYLNKQDWNQAAVDRANTIAAHLIARRVANHFGWIYTKKNS